MSLQEQCRYYRATLDTLQAIDVRRLSVRMQVLVHSWIAVRSRQWRAASSALARVEPPQRPSREVSHA